ncbi:hypothetical protein PSNTI_15030 [Stutzerimonas stutzeri]|nr:hypothetical protein AB691_1445 [Stutzerimonas stutzeri]GBC56042.1 hypothetical protein PSNTI_15030 [Stutzerimonas stutzeri]
MEISVALNTGASLLCHRQLRNTLDDVGQRQEKAKAEALRVRSSPAVACGCFQRGGLQPTDQTAPKTLAG